jgi:hypothetical protein
VTVVTIEQARQIAYAAKTIHVKKKKLSQRLAWGEIDKARHREMLTRVETDFCNRINKILND